MTRSRYLAALLLVAIAGGLIGGRLRSQSTDDPAPVGAGSEVAIGGGEEASTSNTGGADAPAEVDEPAGSPDPAEAPPILDPKPELTNLDGWLQSDATNLASFDGQVRIVQFWTFGCHNCTATIPHLQEIYAEHRDDGLEIIGVHAPEFDRERVPENIQAAAIDLGVTWPIALDTNKTNFRAWQGNRRFWPRTYVLDSEGRVRFDHIGEGKYEELAETVAYLLNEPSS